MKNKLLFLLKYYLFWIFLSLVAKALFLFYQGNEASTLTGGDYVRIFFRGLRLDLSLGGYIMMLSCLIMAVTPFVREQVVRKLFSGITIVLLIVFSGIMTVDLELFKSWGYHLDVTPLVYLKDPKQAVASTPVGLMIGLILILIAFVVAGWFLYRRFVLRSLHYTRGAWWQIPVFLVIGGGMLIPVRGGFNVAPMNSSFVYFHPKSMFANQAAVNPVWNFIYELLHIHKFEGNYNFMEADKAEAIVADLVKTDTLYPRLLKTSRPNIVFLLLESFTANAVGALGGVPGVTPHLDALAKEGVLFSNIYATAGRSDRGMLAAISAFPAHPDIAMIRYPNKTVAHPRFPKDLEKEGYSTRYYYAGDINFGGFRSYVTMSFQSMVTEDDFSGEAIKTRFKWGVHDQYMYARLAEDLKKAPQPFMYMAFNLDSHEPFEVPIPTHIQGDDTENKFLNAVWYTDSCIGKLVEECKSSGLWENTLFILMADHGTRYVGNLSPTDPAMYRIPLIFSGGALQVRDTVIPVIGSQTDMVATLLAQMDLDYSPYKYSKNLLAKDVKPFAFYSYSGATGVVSEYGTSIYNLQSRQYIQTDSLNRNDELLKAWLQSIHTDVIGQP